MIDSIYVITYMTTIIDEQKVNEQEHRQRMLDKANILVLNKKVRRIGGRNLWMVGSGTIPNVYYLVSFVDSQDCFRCPCEAYKYSHDGICCHIAACALYEGGLRN